MPKQRGGGSAFQKVFRQKLRINFREARAGTLRAGAGAHGPPKNNDQIVAISASEARKIIKNRRHHQTRHLH